MEKFVNTTTLIWSIIVVVLIFLSIILIVLKNRKISKLKQHIEELEIEKNMIVNAPVLTELSKVENLVKNERMTDRYNNWNREITILRDKSIPHITDMIIEIDSLLEKKQYLLTIRKITDIEIEIYKSKKKADYLLDEMQLITSSEARNRDYITKLKAQYREVIQKFNKNKDDYGEITPSIELQMENIEKRFKDFETLLEDNEYDEVEKLIDSLDEMIKNITVVVEEVPTIVLMGRSLIPTRVDEINKQYEKLLKDGYQLDYLNIEYNLSEIEKKIHNIFDRAKILNIEDSVLELKTMVEYFDSVMNDFDLEKRSRKVYDDTCKIVISKIKKLEKIMNDLYLQLDDLKVSYDLTRDELDVLHGINKDLELVHKDYDTLLIHSNNKTFAYSKLNKEIDVLNMKTSKLEDRLDYCLETLGTMKDDELRAREQLKEIKSILKEAKYKIKEYKLPVVTNNYFIELQDASDSIKEIVVELEKKPININTLNTRVDTSRDLVLKLYNTTNELVKTAKLAEMAIVYGNRYRSSEEEVENGLRHAESLFYRGDYKKALETSIDTIELIEPGIYNRLLEESRVS
ncbi:MAG: septation ring formation regulator EzrA [Bacilli bacterium]|nr:septation ring formation regulator EzrA [Bacilli bacterium]